jgi:hypothetical protein
MFIKFFTIFFSLVFTINLSANHDMVLKYNLRFGGDMHCFLLEENSIWEIKKFVPRSKSWSEWWNNVNLPIPDELITDASDWKVGCDVVVVPSIKFLDNDLKDLAYNWEDLLYCKWAIINQRTGKVLFANKISIEDFLKVTVENIANDAYSRGYSSGYSYGYSQGYSSGYTNGYSNASSDYHNCSH